MATTKKSKATTKKQTKASAIRVVEDDQSAPSATFMHAQRAEDDQDRFTKAAQAAVKAAHGRVRNLQSRLAAARMDSTPFEQLADDVESCLLLATDLVSELKQAEEALSR